MSNSIAQSFLRDSSFFASPRFTIKLNGATLIDPIKSALHLTSDIKIAPRMSLDIGVGWFYHYYLNNYRGEKMSGLRLRLGGKYFYDTGKNYASYFGFEAKYNYLENKRYDVFARYGIQYNEIALVPKITNTYGLALRLGNQWYLGKKKHFLIDLYYGIGYRLVDVHFKIPADAEYFHNSSRLFNFEIGRGKHSLLDILIGVHLGYVIW